MLRNLPRFNNESIMTVCGADLYQCGMGHMGCHEPLLIERAEDIAVYAHDQCRLAD